MLVLLCSLCYPSCALIHPLNAQSTHDLFHSGLTVFTLSSIAFLALISAAVTFIAIEAVLGTQSSTHIELALLDCASDIVACLVFILWSLFIVASFTTAVVVFVYWAMRLGVFVSREGPSGVTDWAHETRQYIFYARRQEASEESDESAVLVDKDGPTSKKIKVEEEIPSNE